MEVRGDYVYQIQQIGNNTVESFYDNVYNATLEYSNSVLYLTIKSYLGKLATEYSGSIPVIVNGVAHTINVNGGVGTLAFAADWVRATTNHESIRNAVLAVGNEPSTDDRIAQIEAANAMLMLALAESDARQTQTDQTIAELMLAVATGGA